MFLFLFYFIAMDCSQETYQISKSKSTWLNTARNYSLSVPRFDINNSTVNISHVLVKEDLWVGYVWKTTAFEYIGCMQIGHHNAQALFSNTNLGRCQYICGSSMYIGITVKKCFCFDKIPTVNIKHLQCTDTCGSNIFCGGKGSMSLYKSTKVPDITNGPGYCLKVEKNANGRQFKWDDCTADMKTLCLFNNGPTELINGESWAWNVSVQECLKRKGRPTSYKDSMSAVSGTGPVWTGVVRDNVIHKFDACRRFDVFDWYNTSSGTIQFGYVNKSLDRVVLRPGGPMQKLRALADSTKCTGDQTTNDRTSGNVSLMVISVVVVTISVALVVVVIIVYKRRDRILKFCKIKADTTSADVPSFEATQTFSHVNQAFDHYDVVNGQGEVDNSDSSKTNDRSNALKSFEKQFCQTSVTYDVTNTRQRTTDTACRDVCYSTKSDASSTYDHTVCKRNVIRRLGDLYDTPEKAKARYNQSELNMKDGDTYNHLEISKQHNIGKTDNIYGIPDDVRKMTGNMENDSSDTDTYNHLHALAVKTVKPDNPYGDFKH